MDTCSFCIFGKTNGAVVAKEGDNPIHKSSRNDQMEFVSLILYL